MVKNVRSSKSSSHLSPVNKTSVSDSQLRQSIAQLATDIDAFRAKIGLEPRRGTTEIAPVLQQNAGWKDAFLDGQDPGQARTRSNASGDANWDGKVETLYQIENPAVPQQIPGQSNSFVKSSKWSQALSPSLTDLDDGTHPELGMQWADAKPKSLFDTFREQMVGHEQTPEVVKTMEKSLFRTERQEVYPRRELEREILAATEVKKEEAMKVFSVKSPAEYTQPFCDFLTENPTVFHAVEYFENRLVKAGYIKLSEREEWNIVAGGKYFVSRNGSSLIAFAIGAGYTSGNGIAMIAGHIDALTAKLKPVSKKKTTAGYEQLGVAPFAGALNSTWWDRDLGIGGKVLVKDPETGKIVPKLVKLGWPIARIPTLAPHFGVGMTGSQNKETEMVPIIGLDSSDLSQEEFKSMTLGENGFFASTQPPKLVRTIAKELKITDYSSIVNWELELYDTQPAQTGGLDKEFIFGGRIDDKLCSWAAIEALLASTSSLSHINSDDSIIKLVSLFDDEEIGSLLRQGARGNFLPCTVERVVEAFTPSHSANILSRTYANSFLISADVSHAVNPNFVNSYLENHSPRLNVGLVVHADSNGHMTTNSESTALLTRIAEKNGDDLQVFMIRNDSRSGGTVGPMLSSAMGVRAIDAGIPQLSMHSIRATTGSLDPGLGVKLFAGFFEHFENVDKEFE